jgi:hypothetical protein
MIQWESRTDVTVEEKEKMKKEFTESQTVQSSMEQTLKTKSERKVKIE